MADPSIATKVEVAAVTLAVSDGPGSAGGLITLRAQTSRISLANLHQGVVVEYKVNANAWQRLDGTCSVELPLNMAADVIRLRRSALEGGEVKVAFRAERDTVAGNLVDGVATSLQLPRKGVATAKMCQIGVLGQFPPGTPNAGAFLTFDSFPGAKAGVNSVGSSALALIVGDPLNYVMPVAENGYTASVTGGSITALLNTRCDNAANNALLSADGAKTVSGAAGAIGNAWITSNGDVFFAVASNVDGVADVNFLYRAKAGTFTVGSDAAYSNKRACIDIGRYPQVGGVHTPKIKALSSRSFLEAKVGNQTHYYFCEYSTASGRIGGSPGAGADQCMAYRSVDQGTTWEVVMEFNTGGDGKHFMDHFHGVTQDPYSKWIYFMTGDHGDENAIIAYDGKSPKLPANTPFSEVGSKPGFRINFGTELQRVTDLFFTGDYIFGMPDADREEGDPTSIAFVGMRLPRTLEYFLDMGVIPRTPSVPPIMGLQNSTVGVLMLTFRNPTNAAEYASYPYIDVWSANPETGSWQVIAKLKNYRDPSNTSTPSSFFMDNQGRVWIGAMNKKAAVFDPAMTTVAPFVSAKSTSICLTLGDRAAAAYVLESA
ncbi:hypothetical protein IP91_02582 [Pseudoduganella lurida]|uniref:Uncharacterized protein n=1 Tax=Pseudoduganella lurida TaxID=1036180 RepID=A0A562R7Z5_9BURK|nr:hypothetical protein [Pseudoduganella lurida]TWI65175.1 hypothetical protein IP91_02582 [Pseudoduganella lurida]